MNGNATVQADIQLVEDAKGNNLRYVSMKDGHGQ